MTTKRLLPLLSIVVLGHGLLHAESAERLSMTLRRQRQEIYVYRAPSSKRAPVKALFLPGDGGWRGFAIDMAKAIASQGYDVYGWDVKKYLTGFTGKTTLTESEMMADIQEVARSIVQGKDERILLAGWSQGAAMVALAAAAHDSERSYRGVIAIGLPEHALLGWRMSDDVTYITRKEPNEPTFPVAPRLPEIAPLPIAFISSTSDEYITPEEARHLFESAREPKRYFEVNARNHRFSGNDSGFFRALNDALQWVSER